MAKVNFSKNQYDLNRNISENNNHHDEQGTLKFRSNDTFDDNVDVDDDQRKIKFNNEKKTHAFDRANIISQLYCLYAFRFLWKNYKHDFNLDSFEECARDDECRRLGDRLQKCWNRQLAHKDKTKISLLRALLRTFGWRHVRDLFLNFFIYGILRMIMPVLLGRFIYFANLYREPFFSSNNGNSTTLMSEQNVRSNQQGLEWLDKLAISSTDHHLNALFYAGIHPYFMCNFRVGMNIRVALTKLIYDKSLRLSQSAIQRITIGKIVNLISTDASRFDASFMANYFIIGGPLHLIVAISFLYLYIGKACFGAIIIIFLYIPFQGFMANILSRFRSKSIILTDDRLRLMAEILPAMRVIKMYCWEKPFALLVNLARRLEIVKIRHSMIVRSINLAIFF
ncbi:hypothetical protein BLA29_005013, partial [Euroglyphus maynei]